MNRVVAWLTVRQLMGRRRVLLLVLLGALLVLVAILYRATGGDGQRAQVFTGALLANFGAATLMPLVALLLGTAAIGAEIEDGTAIYLLSKPISRASIVFTKLAIAAASAVVLTCVPVFVGALIAAGGLGDGLVVAFTIATAIGSIIYCAIFVALSLVTGRALIFGLLYVLVWEGLLAGLFAGTRIFSVRQQTLAFADALSDLPRTIIDAQLNLTSAVVIGAILLVGAVVIAVRRLQHFEISGEAT